MNDADELMPHVIDNLRALAAECLRQERPDHTLQPTALVNEAYLRLAELDRIAWRDEEHFYAAAAGTIRRILVDHARTKKAHKRGAGWRRVTLTGLAGMEQGRVDVLALEEAMERLDRRDPDLARLVELRFFGGLTVEQVAAMLGVGVTTVKDRWAFARTWLRRELDGGEP